jgi:hypothetical protein
MSEELKSPWGEFLGIIGSDPEGNVELEKDFERFYEKGQKAASSRIRKKLTELQKFAKEKKKEITRIKLERAAAKKAE